MNVFEIARLARQAAVVAIKNNRPVTEVADEIRRVVAEHGINPHRDPNAIGRIYREAVEEVFGVRCFHDHERK